MKKETIEKYYREGRGDWWFYPLWKKIGFIILLPFIMTWMMLCWCIMKLGRGLYMAGDFLSGWRWNQGDWMEEI